MYEKQLLRRPPMYFRYAPPLTGLDEYSPEDLPKEPYKNAPRYMRSVYYYWWLFLKEHEGYMACCSAAGVGDYAKLYTDFGDIRDDDFMMWWKKTGRHLFCEPQEERIYPFPHPHCDPSDPTRIVVSLPLTRDFDRLTAELKQILKPLRKKVPVKRPTKGAKYNVVTRHVLSSLHQHHKVWRLSKEHPELPQHEIADLAGITIDDENQSGTDAKAVKAIIVSRYMKQARCLIDYVGKGYFPVTRITPRAILGKSPLDD